MKLLNLTVPPDIGFDSENLKNYLTSHHLMDQDQYFALERRSVDARQKIVKVNLRVAVDEKPVDIPFNEFTPLEKDVSGQPEVLILGAGPAGLFAALRAIELGVKPIVIERGKDVRARRRDLAAITRDHEVNPNSNYCFGEGGAGTYSDGKLYTRSKKRGSIRKVYETLVAHGATEAILYEAHPHIGTNKLPKLVTSMRKTILEHGGEVHFNSKVIEFVIQDQKIKGVKLESGAQINGKAVILATGHSARDIFRLCKRQNVLIEAKPFALGVRIEHPQDLIDSIQYHCDNRGDFLPAASYSLVHQSQLSNVERGVFSFCMCPGGFIVPAATSPGEVVVNGMSPSRRNSKFANSGIVVAVELKDLPSHQKYQELAAMEFQAEIEKSAWQLGGKRQTAPAQRMVDFLNKRVSNELLSTSYQPGLTSVEMREVLPHFIAERLSQGFKVFGKKMKGYLTNEAQIIGVESRTSSPVRIPRNQETMEHPQISGLFPSGEGAGYAGGIVSAAVDGARCMEKAVNLHIQKSH